MAEVLIKWEPWAQEKFGVAEWAPANSIVPDVYLEPGGIDVTGREAWLGDPDTWASSVNPDKMFAMGYVYIGGKWVKSGGVDSDISAAQAAALSPTSNTLDPGAIGSGAGVLVASVYDENNLGGRMPGLYSADTGLGLVNITLGVSGGIGPLAPVHIGISGLGQVRMGDEGW